MKKTLLWCLPLLAAAAVPVYAEIGGTVAMIGEGAIEFPVGLLKVVGGTLKLVGELILLPFQLIGSAG